ncbi:uncharacterized protein J4E84_007942 [Alternaria hordeiaustralica]|uniref:uncharacterized protein n=1 Tax=Alternaria hordeiaustralica TaxID=1187925 RepID=UPI0020C23744|nr:uncharacterized protein J4E84_007942 [Alternaria hordeiaustralica]KAI4680294.1 hypothetical protein J4E84_007942 [Alternaria hordeiaustralica]
MDPETTRIVLKLQLDDVHAILKALPNTSNDGAVNSERVAFAALRDELTRKWQEVHGRVFAHNMIRKENAGRESFRKLLNEEQQAERDHDMACTLAGQPVPQRPVVSVDNGVHNNAAAQRQEPIDHRTLASNNLRFDLSGTQIAPSRVELLHNKKRPAEDDARPTSASSNFKRARVDDVDDEDRNSITPYTHNSTLKKRTARVDPATLREEDDGRTKRTKLDPQVDAAPVADATHVPSSETVCIAACMKCTQKTCVTCKKKQHTGLCLEDQDVKKLMEVAKAKRWKTCPKCKEMIELEAGCYHIKYVYPPHGHYIQLTSKVPLPTSVLLPLS